MTLDFFQGVGCLLAALLLLIGGALILTSATLIDNFFFSSFRDYQKNGLSGVVNGNLTEARRELRYDLKIASGVSEPLMRHSLGI